MRYVDVSLMLPFLAVYEFYHIHKSIGIPLQHIATETLCDVGRTNMTSGLEIWYKFLLQKALYLALTP